MAAEGRKSREDRLLKEHSGAWGTSSVDFVVLVRDLYRLSKQYAESFDGNCSRFTYCGIPMLLTAIRCLMIEYESSHPTDYDALKVLSEPGDLVNMLKHYKTPDELLQEAKDLNEIRNEIIHPAHLPTGTP